MYKCTMLMQLTTGGGEATALARIGGWSESWYWAGTVQNMPSAFNLLCQRRAAMLPSFAAVVGQRYQQVVPHVTSSQVANVTFPGTAANLPDVPQMSILVKCGAQSGVPNVRQWAMRGLPDARVVNGEYVPSVNFTAAFEAFKDQLQLFNFRGVNLQADQAQINFVDASGNINLLSPLTVAEGAVVQVIKTMNSESRLVGGRFQVDAGPTTTVIPVKQWNLGLTEGGTVRIYEIIYPQVNKATTNLGRITVRKVGRPFFSFRGRRSNRR